MSGQQGQNASDQTANLFWYIVLLTAAVIIAWIFGKQYLVPPLFFIRNIEIFILEWALRLWNAIASYFSFTQIALDPYEGMRHFMMMTDPEKVTIDQVTDMSEAIGGLYRYFLAFIFLILAYITYFRHRSARFAKTYTMKALRTSEVENWPYIAPIVSEDLVKQKLDHGPWAMSKMPLDFCKEHGLLRVVNKQGRNCWSIFHGAAERVFVLQMGSLWEGLERLPIHVKALFVIFVARINREKDVSLRLLAQIARSASTGHLDFSGIETLALKYQNHSAVQWICKRHAYVYTVMASLLDMARCEGVLASAEFLWLKPLDRRMWYALSNVGRYTSFTEVAGIYAHWLAERKIGRALYTPVVNEAVQALELAVNEILYVSSGETWHINSVD